MKKSAFVVSALFLVLFASIAVAQGGRYVRKKLTPNFFIPQSELEHKEVLPPFYYTPPKPAPEVQPAQLLEVIEEDEEDFEDVPAPQPESTVSVPSPQPINIDETTYSQYLKYNHQDLEKTPEYQQKYDDYIKDLNFIAETGNYPENQVLNKDLAMMNSNDRIVVDDTFGIKTPQQPLSEDVQKDEISDISPAVEDNEPSED